MLTKLTQTLKENQSKLHIHQFGFTTTDQLSFSPGVRALCETNSCGEYGKTWACPPGVGTLEECHEKIMQHSHVFVFTTKHALKDSYDFEGMMAGKERHAHWCDQIVSFFCSQISSPVLVLSAEGCSRCASCTYPDAPCRFPEKLSPSVESYGVEVNRLAETVAVNYINGNNTVTYFGCVFFSLF